MTETQPGLMRRLALAFSPERKQSTVVIPARQRAPLNVKSSLLPRGAYGSAYEFFSPDGGRTLFDISSMSHTSLALVAYWYCATRWRAQKIAEAPLMVVEEDQSDGSEEWISDHELSLVLEEPSADFDMGELIERTSRYLDNGGECIWIKDRDKAGRVARLTPFRKGEYEVKSDGTRLFATFAVTAIKGGRKEFDAEEVCYFRDSCSGGGWLTGGTSRLDVAMSWLRLGEKSRQTIRDLLENSVWPSAVIIPDKEWNPDEETYEKYKQDLESYGQSGQQGRPFVQLGGGSFQRLSASIKDLVPSDVLNRVESVVAAVSGVPAVVLQFQVGMENSPWSQMAQARRMAYDDTIQPAWNKLERVMTRQLLRLEDDDKTHFIRFDKTRIQSLQEDRQVTAVTATTIGKMASLNERRQIAGLEPSDDPRADLIPELTEPTLAQLLAASAARVPAAADPATEDDPADDANPVQKKLRLLIQRKSVSSALARTLQDEARIVWQMTAHRLLTNDMDEIANIVTTFLTDAVHKSMESKERGKARALGAVARFLNEESRRAWTKAVNPLLVTNAERAIAVQSAELGVNYSLLHPNAIKFAQKQSGRLIVNVSKTTKQLVNDIVTGALEENRSTSEIARLLRESSGFSKERAALIARTETTTVFNGAPVEALMAVGESTGRVFTKTWMGVGDALERDEHLAMEGETVPIDQPFSNGLMFPSEPNCRCASIIDEVSE